MKTVKPLKLSVLHKVFEIERRPQLAVAILTYFPFQQPERLLPEVSLWRAAAEVLGENAILDECMPKPRAEVLVDGFAFAPGGKPQPACAVRLELGSVDKRLFVVGDREWKPSGVATDPEPFVQMRVDWSHAFGGEGFAENPMGKGAGPVAAEPGAPPRRPLPNVEDPRALVDSPSARPRPAGFGYLDLTWPQRFAKVGTYDAEWLEKHYPGFPRDFDWHFFQAAPDDQWLRDPLVGGEPFAVENMHPEKPRLEGRLPRLVARCFVHIERGGELELLEVPMKPETVRLFPHLERGVLIFRGVTPVAEDDAFDVKHLLAACDEPGALRPASHYARALAERLDKKTAGAAALRDRDLLPPAVFAGDKQPDEALPGELPPLEGRLGANMRRGAEARLLELREQLKAQGLDPDELGLAASLPDPEPAPAGDLDAIADVMAEKLAEVEQHQAEALRLKDEMLERARAQCEEHGIDFDALLAKVERDRAGPPKMNAEAELESLRQQLELSRNAGVPLPAVEAKLRDPDLLDKLRQTQRLLEDAYRKMAHHQPAAARLEGEADRALRASIESAISSKASLAKRDLTGADLSGLDLSGMDLRECFLEAADLRGARLCEANLDGAVLARADLSGADLSGCSLEGANLGRALLVDTKLARARLAECVLDGARLERADLSGARLARSIFMEPVLDGVVLDGVEAERLMVMRANLSGCSAKGARLTDCILFEVMLDGTSFDQAEMSNAALVSCKGQAPSFRSAVLESFRVVHESALPGASFVGARLPRSNFRGTDLSGADFSGAAADSSDFSECDLERASFYRARAHSSLWIRANLAGARMVSLDAMMAIFQKANLEGADFTGANLLRCDFARVRGDRSTRFDDANMKHIRFLARPEGQGDAAR